MLQFCELGLWTGLGSYFFYVDLVEVLLHRCLDQICFLYQLKN